MYIKWLPVLVQIVCHLCLLVKRPDLSKLKDSSMTNDEALTGTLMLWIHLNLLLIVSDCTSQLKAISLMFFDFYLSI